MFDINTSSMLMCSKWLQGFISLFFHFTYSLPSFPKLQLCLITEKDVFHLGWFTLVFALFILFFNNFCTQLWNFSDVSSMRGIQGYDEVRGGWGCGKRNPERMNTREALTHDLVVANTWFSECTKVLITYQTRVKILQIDYMLVRIHHSSAARSHICSSGKSNM